MAIIGRAHAMCPTHSVRSGPKPATMAHASHYKGAVRDHATDTEGADLYALAAAGGAAIGGGAGDHGGEAFLAGDRVRL